MSCLRPRRIPNPRYKGWSEQAVSDYAQETFGLDWPFDYLIDVPCGFCVGCRKSKQSEYVLRLKYEFQQHSPDSCLFLTLTFRDDALPQRVEDLNKPVLRFLDNLRKKHGKGIRHWFICEYGSLNGRAHYHGILFGCPKSLTDVEPLLRSYGKSKLEIELATKYGKRYRYHPIIAPLWKHGFSYVGYVSDETFTYVSKYVAKEMNGGKVRPRLISSKGLGQGFMQSSERAMCRFQDNDGVVRYQPSVSVGAKSVALPRYYFNKVYSDADRQNMALERYLNPTWYLNGKEYKTLQDYEDERKRYLTTLESTKVSLVSAPPTLKRKPRVFKFDFNFKNEEFDL